MRILRSRLVVFALGVVVCQSAALLAAPLAICCAARTNAATADAGADCQCDGAGGLCPMHHKTAAPVARSLQGRDDSPKPAHGARSCSGCADSSEMVFLTMTGPSAPIVAPFRLFTLQPETAAAVVVPSSLAAFDRPPCAPPPKA
ncbi:MAG: hypothetical protein LAO77_05730 [Acidobacteriia bacterium]|nr:hypothetical protein [Terriglobia bacterium]